jgi:hypothetical protein
MRTNDGEGIDVHAVGACGCGSGPVERPSRWGPSDGDRGPVTEIGTVVGKTLWKAS